MDYTIIRSNRKSLAIQVYPDLTVTVRAPRRMPDGEIARIVKEKEAWIERQLSKYEAEQKSAQQIVPFTGEELHDLAQKALAYIPKRVAYFAGLMHVDYGRITIRNQRTRWGSCSSKGNLNFNCLLMCAPPEVIDYIVVHELCHRKQMNHSKAFWQEVAAVLPDYKMQEKWLRTEGKKLMQRNSV